MNTFLRNSKIFTVVFFIANMFLASGILGQTLISDQPDYAPGSTATFTGNGFQPGELVKLQVLHADETPDTGEDHDTWFVTADENGDFVTTWHVCEDDCLGSTLRATANGLISGFYAEVVFTDKSNCAVPTINTNPSNISICEGSNASFTIEASVATGIGTPTLYYQWQVQAGGSGPFNNVGTNSTSNATLNLTNVSASLNGNVYKCIVTNICGSSSDYNEKNATSTSATLTVNPNVVPSVSISSNPGITICSGTSVIFTAIPTNGGSTPVYQWKKNGVNVGTNSTTYTNNELENGDKITCVMTSNVACASPINPSSNELTITVNPLPIVFNVLYTGSLCGTAFITLDGSQIGVNYALKRNTVTVETIAGTGSGFSFSGVTQTGTYTVIATNTSTTCSVIMNGSVVLTGGSPPTVYNVTGGGTFCIGGAGVPVGVDNSQNNVNYQLYRDATPVGSPVAGSNGNAISFGNQTVAGTYTVIATNNSGCTSEMTGSAVITVKTESTAPTGASTDEDNICPGTEVILSFAGGSLGTNATWKWYTVSCGGTAAGTGTTINVSPSVTTTYYVRAEGDCNTASCTSVNVTVKTESTAPSSASTDEDNICPGTEVTLSVSGGSLGTNASWKWYTASCGGTLVDTGATINVSPSVTTTYYVRAEGDCNTTTCVEVTVTVKTESTAPSSASTDEDDICPGTEVILSVSGGSLGTGASWEWYTASCGGTPVNTGATINVSPSVTTTYYVRAEGDCNTTSCVSVTVTVKTESTAPSSASTDEDDICPGTEVTLSVSGGSLGTNASWEWYTASCGGTLVNTGATINVSPSVTTTYYVRAEGDCNTTTCASVTVTVKTESVAASTATTSANNFCPGGNTDLGITGGSLGTGALWHWYTGSCGGTEIGTGASINVSPSVTTTYYVRAEGDCNTTTCASVTVTVKTESVAPTGASTDEDNICPGTEVALSVSGGSLGTGASWKWYTVSCGGTAAGTGSSIYVSPTVTTTYYVRAEGDCNMTTSESVTVTVKKTTTVETPVATKTSWIYGCETATITVVADGEGTLTYQWKHKYLGVTTTVGTNSNSYTVPELAGAGIHEYWVIVSAECGTATSTTVTITITPQEADAVNDGEAYYTGPSIAFTANPTSSTSTFTLSAFVQNSDDVNCGDIATARLSFFYRVAGGGAWTKVPNGQNQPVNYVDPANPSKGGTAAVIAQLNIGSGTCELYDILVTISGNYIGNDAQSQSQITITKPQPGGTISGGAKLNNTSSTGFVKGAYKSELGFFVNYALKAGKPQNPKGKVNLIVKSYNDRYGNVTSELHQYKITSNAIASMAITGAKATFTSKANIAEIINGETVSLEGNCILVMELEDKSCGNNQQDLLGIVIYRNSGGIWYSNNYTSKGITVPTTIYCGDVYVSGSGITCGTTSLTAKTTTNATSSSKITIVETQAEEITEQATVFNVMVYPNPSVNQFTVAVEGSSAENVKVMVFDVLGRLLKTIEKKDGEAIQFGEDLPIGSYIAKISQGAESKTVQLIKK